MTMLRKFERPIEEESESAPWDRIKKVQLTMKKVKFLLGWWVHCTFGSGKGSARGTPAAKFFGLMWLALISLDIGLRPVPCR